MTDSRFLTPCHAWNNAHDEHYCTACFWETLHRTVDCLAAHSKGNFSLTFEHFGLKFDYFGLKFDLFWLEIRLILAWNSTYFCWKFDNFCMKFDYFCWKLDCFCMKFDCFCLKFGHFINEQPRAQSNPMCIRFLKDLLKLRQQKNALPWILRPFEIKPGRLTSSLFQSKKFW